MLALHTYIRLQRLAIFLALISKQEGRSSDFIDSCGVQQRPVIQQLWRWPELGPSTGKVERAVRTGATVPATGIIPVTPRTILSATGAAPAVLIQSNFNISFTNSNFTSSLANSNCNSNFNMNFSLATWPA
ncbi:unnamed protein product [Toxocara canis]|uniref:Secreted protein n=1 Tax=Toxocara canis TaxID=6265 RepID=A0A183U431_TOXCA|nr:unnamed protein product [Toxocara canis]